MNTNAPKAPRLVARVSQDVQELIQSAAELSGTTVSQFLVDTMVTKAKVVIAEATTMKLSLEGSKKLFALLDSPPPLNNKLKALAERYNRGEIYEQSLHDASQQTARP